MLILVPVPLGNAQDLSFHAKEILSSATVIIVEEFKESSQWLRAHGITGKQLERLNEHSNLEDLNRLADLCGKGPVPLITDCGTPGFCDPGADLVSLCRSRQIPVRALPGPSSLMMLLSLSSQRLDEFYFRGFLPAENEARARAYRALSTDPRAIILMDTPYRFEKMLSELEQYFSKRKILLTCNLTQDNEQIFEGLPHEIRTKVAHKKAEFMVLIYPQKAGNV